MSTDLLDYPGWVAALNKWGLARLTAVLLEAAAPLNFIAAQAIYVGEPALRGIFPETKMRSMARMLEDPHATGEFVRQLRSQS